VTLRKKRARICGEMISYMNTVLRDVVETWLQFTICLEKLVASSTIKREAEIFTEKLVKFLSNRTASTPKEHNCQNHRREILKYYSFIIG
jgi:hypothetical protein